MHLHQHTSTHTKYSIRVFPVLVQSFNITTQHTVMTFTKIFHYLLPYSAYWFPKARTASFPTHKRNKQATTTTIGISWVWVRCSSNPNSHVSSSHKWYVVTGVSPSTHAGRSAILTMTTWSSVLQMYLLGKGKFQTNYTYSKEQKAHHFPSPQETMWLQLCVSFLSNKTPG